MTLGVAKLGMGGQMGVDLTEYVDWSSYLENAELVSDGAGDNTVRKSAGITNWNSSGASASLRLSSIANDPWVTFTADNNATDPVDSDAIDFVIGFSTTLDGARTQTAPAYDLFSVFSDNGQLKLYVGGAFFGAFGTMNTGDILRIQFQATDVKFYINDVQKARTFGAIATLPAYLECSLYNYVASPTYNRAAILSAKWSTMVDSSWETF